MRAAPTVDYPLSPSGFWRRASALLGSAVSGVTTFWLASFVLAGALPAAGPGRAVGMVGALMAALVAGLVGGRLAWRGSAAVAGSLRWDGGQWLRLPAPGGTPQAGRPELVLDWGDWLLLRWYPALPQTAPQLRPRGGACLALARREAPAHWHLLRVALLQSSRQSAAATSAAPAGAAEGGRA